VEVLDVVEGAGAGWKERALGLVPREIVSALVVGLRFPIRRGFLVIM